MVDNTQSLTPEDIQALQKLQQQGNVHVHSGPAKATQRDLSPRHLGTMIAGGIGAAAGYFGTKIYINQKMFDFDRVAYGQTRDAILGRSGLAAGVDEAGGLFAGGGRLGAGISSGEIHTSYAMDLAKSGEFGSVPKFIYKTLGGPHGRSALELGGAAVVGGAAALLAYSMMKDNKKPEKMASWSDKIENEPQPTRDRSE